jgi:hypothetical protein
MPVLQWVVKFKHPKHLVPVAQDREGARRNDHAPTIDDLCIGT